MKSSIWLLSAHIALALGVPVISHAAQTAVATRELQFSIPAQELGLALNTWSKQAGVQIAYPAQIVANRRSPAVEGRMSSREALNRLLAGSGLEIGSDEGGLISLREASVGATSARPRERARVETSAVAPVEIEELIVTAQRREQAAVDVPFALTAFSGDALETLGAVTLRDVSLYTPGLLVEDQSPNNPIFVMRGITSSGGDSFTEPRVAVFQDGVPISKSRGSFVELFDIERVEVSKGPQSTLFGRGALIGGINVIQNRATPELAGAAAVEGGNLGYVLADGMLNVPLSDSVSFRVAARHRERDGYQENLAPDAEGDLNSLELNAYRAVMSLRTGERLSADLIVNYQEERTDGTGFKSMYLSPTDPVTGQVLAGTDTDDAVWLSVPEGFATGNDLGVDQQYAGVTALLEYEINDAMTLNSISGYRDVDSIEVYDADGISLPLFTNMEDNGGRFFNQELRLNFDTGGPVTGMLGLNYYRERARSKVDVLFDERMLLAQVTGMLNGGPLLGLPATTPAPAALFANTAFTGALVQGLIAQQTRGNILLNGSQAAALAAQLDPAHVETNNNTADTDSYDVFADMTFRPQERWEVSAGVRYTRDDKVTRWGSSVAGRSVLGGIVGASGLAASGTPAGIATARALLNGLTAFGADLSAPLPYFGINAQPTPGNGSIFTQSLDDDGFTWRLASRYELADQLNLYGSYARGRRAAVLSAAAPSAPDGTPVFAVAPAETADTYELGLKFESSEHDVRLDTSLYYYEYDNFQTRELIGSSFVTTNAGAADAYGAELQGMWRAFGSFELFASYAYNHTRFNRGAYEGNRFARSPDHMFSLGAILRMPAPAGMVEFRPTYTWRSKIFFADDNDRRELQSNQIVPDLIVDEFQDSFGLLNLRLGYVPDRGNWDVEAFVSNLTDEVYRKGAGSAGGSIGLPTNVLGDPRYYGIRFSIRR
ncbi:MAG TPA: TonB-dependent receptor [Steroidobacter sp.]|uniref:TonB-dependent receptor n=1 Tax=Steroidobacter sp. TaxID=1978227 RepID=UPI002ED7C30F